MNTIHPILANIHTLANEATWERTRALADEMLAAWLANFDAGNLERIYFAGCGTSYYAGQVAKYIVEHIAHIPAEAAQAFAFATYAEPQVLGPRTLLVGISTTGGSEAVVDALTPMRERQAQRLWRSRPMPGRKSPPRPMLPCSPAEGMTRFQSRPNPTCSRWSPSTCWRSIWPAHERVVLQPENHFGEAEIQRASEAVMSFLDSGQPAMEELAQLYSGAGNVFVLGTGPNCGTAEEASLKVIEMAKVYSEAQELEDFLHGRFREVDQANPMFFLAPHGHASARILDFLAATDHVGAPSVVLTDHVSPGIRRLATHIVEMPGDLHEFITPLLYIVPMYLFSYHLAFNRGFDPAARRYNFVPQKMRYEE